MAVSMRRCLVGAPSSAEWLLTRNPSLWEC